MSLLMTASYPMQFIILLLISFLVSTVTTFSLIQKIKDVFNYEHCGSVWIDPDINGTVTI